MNTNITYISLKKFIYRNKAVSFRVSSSTSMLHLSNSVCRQSKAYVNTLPRNVRNGTSNSTHTRGGKDFRPSWVYLASHILTYSVIPCELYLHSSHPT